MTFPLLQALQARILFVRIKVNEQEKQMIEDAVARKFGEEYSVSNAIRQALNLLLDIDLPEVKQGAPEGNRHHEGKRGGNQYTVDRAANPLRSKYCVWCQRGK